jgi:Flp pilus assembly protein CpaB
MQAMVPRGMRAVAVEVSEGSAVAGLISPGCYVDVIATFNNGDQTVATTVVQNVKVQFVQRARPPRSSGSNAASAAMAAGSPDALGAVKTVTLIVTPRQANSIELANNQGKPRLVLRGGADDTDMADSTVSQNELLGIPDPPPPATQPAPAPVAAAPPQPPVIEMTDAFGDLVAVPPPPPKRVVYTIRGSTEGTHTFEDEPGTSPEEQTTGPAVAAVRPSPSPQKPTTRPHQPKRSGDRAGAGGDRVESRVEMLEGGEPRTASGASPGDPVPRAGVGRKDLRKGM